MIDKARVEEIERITRGNGMPDIHQLAAEHIAMRDIVEALAAIPPFYIDPYQDRRCAICEAKIGIDEHAELCAYRRAVALVGPAGERSEER